MSDTVDNPRVEMTDEQFDRFMTQSNMHNAVMKAKADDALIVQQDLLDVSREVLTNSKQSLRDHFAGQALAGTMSMYTPKDIATMSTTIAEFRRVLAKSAYFQADAMLKERAK